MHENFKMENELYHHGVKGMRWGVRRYQKKNGSLTAAGKKRYSDKRSNKNVEPQKETGKKRLSDKQKKYIKVGVAVTATVLIAYGGYKLGKSGKLDSLVNRGRQSPTVKGLNLDVSKKQGFSKLKTKESVEDVIKNVNPSGSRNNCYNVVVGTVSRLCGVDVTAKGDTQSGRGLSFNEVCKVFKLDPDNPKDVVRVNSPTADRLSRQIGKRFTEGDIGAVAFEWNSAYKSQVGISSSESAAHTLNWMVKDGQVLFMDGQAKISGDRLFSIMQQMMDSGKESAIAKFANTISGLDLENDIDVELFKKFVD